MQGIWNGIQARETASQTAELQHKRIMQVLTVAERQKGLSAALTGLLCEHPGSSWNDVADALCESIAAGMLALASIVPDPEQVLSTYLGTPAGTTVPPAERPGPGRPISPKNLAAELGIPEQTIWTAIQPLNGTATTVWWMADELLTGAMADALRAEFGPSEEAPILRCPECSTRFLNGPHGDGCSRAPAPDADGMDRLEKALSNISVVPLSTLNDDHRENA